VVREIEGVREGVIFGGSGDRKCDLWWFGR